VKVYTKVQFAILGLTEECVAEKSNAKAKNP